MFNISSYTKSELVTILRGLKLYRTLDKQVGKRGRELFARSRSPHESYRVEYVGESHADLEPLVLSTYQSRFDIQVPREQIIWKRNDALKWGVRLFVGDDMVDVSFKEAERRVLKS
ncbi:MAG: hypothetical protein ACD_78C00303G0005 [uncultured bacterium (gcode 4)]|uniref:Uncharacterized protein n=1 Tax=uncultured bacterium (gcode 4) TaxID=1234023 RepID=K1XWY9_9BACT|nr:MAG: hypothetical protein ACD_78C00303G0005 [uncultured bacterium (gcode 4)]